MNRDIGAIVVTYNPDSDVIDNINQISRQAKRVLVIDNGSLERIAGTFGDNVDFVYLNDNFGIAHAFNIGILNLVGEVDNIATFDQDTRIEDGYFLQIFRQFEESNYANRQEYILVPSFSGLAESIDYGYQGVKPITVAISSGSIISSSVFRKIGLFNDMLFIDYVDNEFCLRARSKDIGIYEVSGVKLNHRLGNMTSHNLLGWVFHTSNHSPIRKYYVYRNRVFVYQNYFWKFKRWFLRDLLRSITEIIKILLWEEEKNKKLRFISYGICSAFMGRYGKFQSANRDFGRRYEKD